MVRTWGTRLYKGFSRSPLLYKELLYNDILYKELLYNDLLYKHHQNHLYKELLGDL